MVSADEKGNELYESISLNVDFRHYQPQPDGDIDRLW